MKRSTASLLIIGATIMLSGQLSAQSADAETGASAEVPQQPTVAIISPQDGDVVESPITVVFGIQGMALAPAGTFEPGTGHHHLLIDTRPGDAGVPIPATGQSIHFGKAQSQATVELAAGQHTLQLLLGDGNHIPHSPAIISKQITITVK